MAASDNIIYVNTTAAPRTITLPVPTNGRLLTIKDSVGNAATNNITINQHSSEKIDGANSATINTNWGEMQLTSNGTDWFTNQAFVGASVSFPLLASAGSAGAPSYSFSGDSDTGIWSVAANNISFSTAGNEVVRIGSTGNVSILNDAALRLFSSGSANFVSLLASSTSATYTITLPAAAPATNTVLEFDGTNYVWNPVTPTFPLLGPTDSASAPNYSWSGDSDTGMFTVGANNISFATAGVERLRIGPTGNLSVVDNATIRLFDATSGNSNFISFRSAATLTASYSLILPATGPATNTVLQFDGTNYVWFPLSGTNTGDVTIGSFGSTPNANGLSISSQVLNLQPADATHPGSISTGDQTIPGKKTFAASIVYTVTQVASTASIAQLTSSTPVVEITGTTNTDIHGIAAGSNGQRITIFWLGMGTLTVKQNSGTATGVDRIQCPSSTDLVFSGGSAQAVELMYSTSSSRWLVINRSV